MGQYQRKHQRKKKAFRFTRIYGVICVLLILAAVVGGSIVFFRVDNVTVEGNSRYTQEEIVNITGIQDGDNLFLINKYEIINTLLTKLTYVDEVSIRRSLPSTIRITVTECGVAAAVQDTANNTWWLVSSSGKLLERADAPGDYLQVTGLNLVSPSEGTAMAVKETDDASDSDASGSSSAASANQRLQRSALLELLGSLESRELLANAQAIDLSSSSIVTMQYDGRLEVRMKLSSDFDYQVRVLGEVMNQYVSAKWTAEDTGTLDLTMDDGLPHLIRDAA